MKTRITLLLILVFLQNTLAQNFSGHWKGELNIQNTTLPLIFNIKTDEKSHKSTFDSPLQGAKNIPFTETKVINHRIKLAAKNLNIEFEGLLDKDIIKGVFKQNGIQIPLSLSRVNEGAVLNRPQTPKAPFNYINKEVTFKNIKEQNILAGTLTTPKNCNKNKPVVILITGSGTQNRDEELFGHKPFLIIADALANQGISSLRLDDRGIGGSTNGQPNPTSKNFADDINTAVHFLLDQGFSNIGLIGHSEGGMIAPMVASTNDKIKFLVLLAAPGVPIDQLLTTQIKELSQSQKINKAQLNANQKMNAEIYRFIKNSKNIRSETEISELIKELNGSLSDKEMDLMIKQLATPWFQYFIKFNPDCYLSLIKIPTLAINGSLDKQVASKENLEGIRNSLIKANNTSFIVKEFKNLNHLLQTAHTGYPNEYPTIEETISPDVLKLISKWILNNVSSM